MTEERLQRITDRYNKERNDFNFPTISASKEGIKSILNIYKDFEELSDDKLIFKLAVYLNELAFGWD